MSRFFLGTFVCCSKLGKLDIHKDYLLRVDSEGFITHFLSSRTEEASELLARDRSAEIHELPKQSFMLPTFCDLHLHAPQMLYLGTGNNLPLMSWLEKHAYQAEEKLDSDPILAETVYKRLAQRLADHGTGAVLMFGTIKVESNLILAKVFQEKGIRAFIGKLSMDISPRATYREDPLQAPEAAREFVNECTKLVADLPIHKRFIHPVITPRFIPTSSPGLLSKLGAIAKEDNLMIQSHMAESKDEVETVQNLYKAKDIDVFNEHNLLTSKTVQAHCTFADKSDLAQLAQCGTSVSHCPLSNCFFSTRPYPLREALDAGVKVGLGTDVAGGYRLDMMSTMRMAVVIASMRENDRQNMIAKGEIIEETDSLKVTWIESLYLATTGGMIALGIIEKGKHPFQVGVPFDAQQINVYDGSSNVGIGELDFFEANNDGVTEDVVEKWWSLGDTRNRGPMYIQGRLVK